MNTNLLAATGRSFSSISISTDTLILAGVCVGLGIIGYFYGQEQLKRITLSLYVGYAAALSPIVGLAQIIDSKYRTVAVFTLAALIGWFALTRFVETYSGDLQFYGILKLIAISMLTGGLFLAMTFHGVSIASVYTFSPTIGQFFSSLYALLFWFVAPLLLLRFV